MEGAVALNRQRPVRVLIIAGYAPSLVNFRGHLIAGLRHRGHEVICAAPGTPAELSVVARRLECPVFNVPLARAGVNPIVDIGLLVSLLRLMARVRPQWVFAYTIKPVIYGGIAARCSGLRFSALITGLGWGFLGGSWLRRGLTQILGIMYRAALSGAHKVFFQNPDDRHIFIERDLIRLAQTRLVRGSGIDLRRFTCMPLPEGQGITFLLIARLLWDKGLAEFVAAAQEIRKRVPHARFRLIGDHDANPAAVPIATVHAWVDAGWVEWPGSVIDVRPEIAGCTVYVLPSYREGTPRTVLEAMAMGRPIITTNAPGCRETVIDGANGFLVPVRDAQALVEAMMRFIDDPGLASRMGQRSRQLAEERFNVHRVNATIIRELGL